MENPKTVRQQKEELLAIMRRIEQQDHSPVPNKVWVNAMNELIELVGDVEARKLMSTIRNEVHKLK